APFLTVFFSSETSRVQERSSLACPQYHHHHRDQAHSRLTSAITAPQTPRWRPPAPGDYASQPLTGARRFSGPVLGRAPLGAMRPRGKRVVLVDTHRFALLSRSKKKTDRDDATLLARFLKMGWLPTVSVPDKRVRQLRQLFHARESLVEMPTKLKNRGQGALTRNGLALGHQAFRSEKSRERVRTLAGLSPADQHIVQVALRQL